MRKNLTSICPAISLIKLFTEPDMYGASSIISKQLKISFQPRSYGYWQHGWMSIPLRYLDQYGLDFDGNYLVGTKEEELFLRSFGKTAFAVGLPYVYAKHFESVKINRKANSLLVLPPHGASYTKKKWKENNYIEAIDSIRKDFEFVIACISPSDIEKGEWTKSFKNIGVDYIAGANMFDKNALFRMNRLFNYFEYVTTNSIGSHVAYAAYSGAKVSIFGPYDFHDVSSLSEDALFKTNKELLEYFVEMSSYSAIKKKYSKLFFNHPSLALNIELYGQKWVGSDNIRQPNEIARLLGWYPEQQIYNYSARAFKKIKKEIRSIFSL
jgi:hypothetical protein